MEYRLIGICAFYLTVACDVRAQSSLTLYGILDVPVLLTSAQQTGGDGGSLRRGNSIQMGITGQTQSEWGLRGTEDLGDGRSVIFNLTSYLLANTGQLLQADSLFDRSAYVGLKDDRFGTLTIGRQTESYSDLVGPYASSNIWATAYGAHFGDVDNLNQAFNFNNAIKFSSAAFGDFSFTGTVSLGGTPGSIATNMGYAGGGAYNHGPYSAGIAYIALRNPLSAALGGSTEAYIGDFSCTNVNALYCELQNSSSMTALGAGASVVVGTVTFGATYTHTRMQESQFRSPVERAHTAVKFDIGEFNALYQVQPDFSVGIAYIFNNVKPEGVASTHIQQINLGTTYSLSKRTAVYLVAIGQVSSGRGLGTSPAGQATNYAQIPVLSNSPTDHQATILAGLRTSF
jgi:predicted porin